MTIRQPSKDVKMSIGYVSLEFTRKIQVRNKFAYCLCVGDINVQRLGEISLECRQRPGD